MSQGHCTGYRAAESLGPSRRGLLLGTGLAAIGWLATPKTALADLAIRTSVKDGPTDTVVVLFLRGGADGLNAVIPYADEDYYRLRPTLAIGAPDTRRGDRALDLNGFFGLHPSLRNLMPLYESNELAIVQAVGSGDQTRSHFEAMSAMERGLAEDKGSAIGGWLARYLAATSKSDDSPLRAVALSNVMPDSLLGATGALSLPDVEDYRLHADDNRRDKWMRDLQTLYGGDDALSHSGADTLRVIKRLSELKTESFRPATGAAYPDTPVGEAMRQVALLLKAEVGLEVACVDFGGWDTHVTQGATTGWQPGLFNELANSISAFHTDLGDRMKRVTVVVMTEFGRRVHENAGLGTDHGRASFMMLLGGGVRGGQVAGVWPGLAKEKLEGTGDLRVTTDYRSVLSEVLLKRTRLASTEDVFPSFQSRPLGLLDLARSA